MPVQMPADTQGLMFILLAIVIFLALLAALGSWVRGGGLKREELESVLDSHRKSNDQALEATRAQLAETQAHMAKRMGDLEARITASFQDVQGSMKDASSDQEACIGRHVDDLRSGMNTALEGQRRSQEEGIEALKGSVHNVQGVLGTVEGKLGTMHGSMGDMNDSLGRMGGQIESGVSAMRDTLMEISRQQQEQKAHSAIQLCEALINSLGTLRNSIASQVATDRTLPESVESFQTTEAFPLPAEIQDAAFGTTEFSAEDENIFPSPDATESKSSFTSEDEHHNDVDLIVDEDLAVPSDSNNTPNEEGSEWRENRDPEANLDDSYNDQADTRPGQ